MKKVANRAALSLLQGLKPLPAQEREAGKAPELDPYVSALQEQVVTIAQAIGQMAYSIHVQQSATPRMEATIERDKSGRMEKVIIRMLKD